MHQPLRINPNADSLENLFSGSSDPKVDNKAILKKVVDNCYLPATDMMLELLNKYTKFKIAYSISGVLLDQLEKDFPEVIELLKMINETGRVEFLDETYFHSLSSIYSEDEFVEQISLHKNKMQEMFNKEPSTFRNTEIIYSDNIGELVKELGYKRIIAEGADRILKWKQPNHIFQTTSGLPLLLKNYKLSDDLAFRFADKSSYDYPITLEKYLRRLNKIQKLGNNIVNLFMDYETFGEHQNKDTGIFSFFENLIENLVSNGDFNFITPDEINTVGEVISMPDYVSWADYERDTSAWNSNDIQQESLKLIYDLEERVKNISDKDILKLWRYLQISDHFYYMCTKKYGGENSDIDVHTYFSPYDTPRKAYEAYMNALNIFKGIPG